MNIYSFKIKKAFTLVELVLSIALIAIIVPVGAATLTTLSSSVVKYQRISQAVNIAKDYMTVLNRLPFSSPDLLAGPPVTTTNYKNSGFNITKQITNLNLPGGSETDLEVLKQITVNAKSPDNSINIQLDTLRAKNVWFGIPAQAPGQEALLLEATQASAALWQSWLYNFSLRNTSTTKSITIDKFSVTWTPIVSGQKLMALILKGTSIFSGKNYNSGTVVDITDTVFTPNQQSLYNQVGFTKKFPPGTKVTFTLKFIMKDASEKTLTMTLVAQ